MKALAYVRKPLLIHNIQQTRQDWRLFHVYNFLQFIVGDDTEIGPGYVQPTSTINNFDQPLAKQGAHTRAVEVDPIPTGANVTLLSGNQLAHRCCRRRAVVTRP